MSESTRREAQPPREARTPREAHVDSFVDYARAAAAEQTVAAADDSGEGAGEGAGDDCDDELVDGAEPIGAARSRGVVRPASASGRSLGAPVAGALAGPLAGLRERFEALRDDPRVAAGALVVMALVSGLLWYRSALDAGPSAGEQPGSEPAPVATAQDTTSTAASVVVHVSGAVAEPGLHRLAPGARVADALAAAGGPSGEAEVERLNLAAPVADGRRVHVPRPGEALPEGAVASGSPGSPGGATLVDVNTASLAGLESLPGIGPTIAAAIVEERDRRGGFRSVEDLLAVRGIGEAKLADLRELVTV